METLAWTQSRKPYNQDAVAVADNIVVVADGVTPFATHPDADRLTAEFSHALVTACARFIADPNEVLSGLNAAVRHARQEIDSDLALESTLSIVTWDSERVVCTTLGDSPLIVDDVYGNRERIIDPQFESEDNDALNVVKSLVAQGLEWKDAYSVLEAQLKDSRKTRNLDGGLFIPATHGDVHAIVERFWCRSFSRENVQAITLTTDGAEAFKDTFSVLDLDWCDVTEEDLDQAWDDAMKLQLKDVNKSEFPRLSDRDDATVARVMFNIEEVDNLRS